MQALHVTFLDLFVISDLADKTKSYNALSLCSDGASAYKTFAKDIGIRHYRCITSKGTRVIGGAFHILGVNGYMGRFRTWIARFNGVNSNYLANYLGWMRAMEGIK
jgi:hypothetical protein